MSVSDDSKVKLIETKTEIVYSILKQIKNKEFQKCLSLTELKARDPLIYDVIEKYDRTSLECHFDVEEVYQQLNESIKSKCIEILRLITGQDIDCDQMSDFEIQNLFEIKLNKLNEEITENQTLIESFEKKFENFERLFNHYLDVVHQYYSKYKIPFKLKFDEMVANLSVGKAQTLCVRNRYLEVETIAEEYGNKEKIQKLNEERKALESEQFLLKSDLKKAEQLLSEYENLDPILLKEYRHLKSELELHNWALNELNQSSASNCSRSGLSE